MPKKIEMFEAFNGQVFRTDEECRDYEQKLQDEEKVDEFLRSKYNIYDKSAHLTVAENTLNAYNAWLRGEKPVVKEEATDE